MFNQLIKLYESKDFDGLLNFCNTELENDSINYLLLGAKGRALFELEKYEEAIKFITDAIQINKEYVAGYFNRGLCYYFTDNFEYALSDLEKSLQLGNTNYEIYFYLGGSNYFKNEFEKSIEFFSIYLDNCEDENALKWRADIYSLLGDKVNENNDLTKLLELKTPRISEFENLNDISKLDFQTESIKDNLTELGFSFFYNPDEIGIYILEFSNCEFYIGQTINIGKRIKQHFKTYKDIQSILFKPLDINQLTDYENKIINKFEKEGCRIRNLKQLNFRNLFDFESQQKWLKNKSFNFTSGTKYENESVREKFSDRFSILKGKAYYEELIFRMSIYFDKCLPNYLASEFNYWNITCFPKYLIKENCILRININNVPVLTVTELENSSFEFMLFCSILPFLKKIDEKIGLNQILYDVPNTTIDVEDNFEEQAKGDLLRLFIKKSDFLKSLENETILTAIRTFNLRMLNSIGKEEKFRRSTSHCLDLSDAIILKTQN